MSDLSYRSQYWQIQCPHCFAVTYYHVSGFLESDRETERCRRWPILRCRCEKWHSQAESRLCRFTFAEAIPPGDVRPLVKRQAVRIDLDVVRKE